MSEPRRLKERSAALPGQLADALEGAPGGPTELELHALARGLGSSLGIALAAPTAAAAAAAAAKAAAGHGAHLPAALGLAAKPSLSFLVWFGGGVAVGTLLSATVLISPALWGGQRSVAFQAAPGASTAARAARAPAPMAPSVTAQASAQLVVPERAAEVPDPRRAPARVAHPVASDEFHEEKVAQADTEHSLLRKAQQTVRADPARALDLCAEHAAQFPAGAMAQEREIIAIEALQRLGRAQDARARARQFFERFPGSAHAARLEQVLGREKL